MAAERRNDQSKAESNKAQKDGCESHTSLHTLSAWDLEMYLSAYPIFRYSSHMNCKMRRLGATPVTFSPSLFQMNHFQMAHPLSATWETDVTCGNMLLLF